MSVEEIVLIIDKKKKKITTKYTKVNLFFSLLSSF